MGSDGGDGVARVEVDDGNRAILGRVVKAGSPAAEAVVLDRQIRVRELHGGERGAVGARQIVKEIDGVTAGECASVADDVVILLLLITSAGGKLPPLPVAGAGEAEDGAAARSLHGGIEVSAAGHPANPKRQGHTAAGFSTDHKRGRDDGAQARLVDEGGGHLPEPTGLAGHALEERELALRLGQQASKSLEVSTGDG